MPIRGAVADGMEGGAGGMRTRPICTGPAAGRRRTPSESASAMAPSSTASSGWPKAAATGTVRIAPAPALIWLSRLPGGAMASRWPCGWMLPGIWIGSRSQARPASGAAALPSRVTAAPRRRRRPASGGGDAARHCQNPPGALHDTTAWLAIPRPSRVQGLMKPMHIQTKRQSPLFFSANRTRRQIPHVPRLRDFAGSSVATSHAKVNASCRPAMKGCSFSNHGNAAPDS